MNRKHKTLVILLYGLETWVLSEAIDKNVEGSHTGFLRKMTRKRVRKIVEGKWETTGTEVVREAAGMQLVMTYIWRWQATVAQWMALRKIFEVCAGEKGYEGGGRRRDDWWRQEAT